MADWIAALGDLPQIAVADAIAEWIRGETRRPTPADIRNRARARVEPKPTPKPDEDEWPFRPNVISAEQVEERRARAQQIIREVAAKKRDTGTQE